MLKRHTDMLGKATDLAKLSSSKFRHGAIIVKSGRVLAVGINRDTNHPDIVTDPLTGSSIHAEVAALKACKKSDLKGATIYIARVGKMGQQAMSKPCINCQKALIEAGIDRVYFTINDEMDLNAMRTREFELAA